jgi:urease accessory protein
MPLPAPLWSNKPSTGVTEAAIHHFAATGLGKAVSLQPRARGAGAVCVRVDEQGQTRIENLRQSGSLKLVFPRTYRPDAEAILVNTAGGVTGGDRFDLLADVGAGAHLTLTTQAAERAYRAQTDELGRINTMLTVGPKARLNWLPQEMILFDKCALRRNLTIDLAKDARLLMVEPLVFGRAAMQERMTDIHFQDRILVTRGAQPIYRDGMDLQGDASTHLARPGVANGAGAMASLVFVAPEAASQLNAVRALLPKTAGASMVAPDLLVMRLLALDSFERRTSLIPVLDHLTHNTLPLSWRL